MARKRARVSTTSRAVKTAFVEWSTHCTSRYVALERFDGLFPPTMATSAIAQANCASVASAAAGTAVTAGATSIIVAAAHIAATSTTAASTLPLVLTPSAADVFIATNSVAARAFQTTDRDVCTLTPRTPSNDFAAPSSAAVGTSCAPPTTTDGEVVEVKTNPGGYLLHDWRLHRPHRHSCRYPRETDSACAGNRLAKSVHLLRDDGVCSDRKKSRTPFSSAKLVSASFLRHSSSRCPLCLRSKLWWLAPSRLWLN